MGEEIVMKIQINELVARQNKEAYEKAINDIKTNFGNITNLFTNSQEEK